MSHLTEEIASQPGCWSKAIETAGPAESVLPYPGERVAAVGCGSSLNVARCYAALREAAGQGETDAYPASEMPATRRYDRLLFISRTGTTTEVLDALRRTPHGTSTTAVTADPGAPLAREARDVVLLDFADERSVVSSRFITSSIVLLRAHLAFGASACAGLGADIRALPDAAAREVARPLPAELAERAEFTFLGRGWAAAIADEAALKLREASRTWAESYPAMEYRHGPISVSDENTVVWALGEVPADLLAAARRTGTMVITSDADPLAGLIGAQKLAAALAERKGIDPDQPRALSRSVILGLYAPGPGRRSDPFPLPPVPSADRRPRGDARRGAKSRLDSGGRKPDRRGRLRCGAPAGAARSYRHRPERGLGAAGLCRHARARGRRHIVQPGTGRRRQARCRVPPRARQHHARGQPGHRATG
jgi:fructoselysine-6-P-deglycase FrlB-like protein